MISIPIIEDIKMGKSESIFKLVLIPSPKRNDRYMIIAI